MTEKSWAQVALRVAMGDLTHLQGIFEAATKLLSNIEEKERAEHLAAAAKKRQEREALRERRRTMALEQGIPEILAIENGPYEETGTHVRCECG